MNQPTDGRGRRLGLLAELTGIAMACAAPWMLGSVSALAALGLTAGAGLVGTLAAASGRGTAWKHPAGLAIAGLALLAYAQTLPLPGGLLGAVDPGGAALRRSLLPETPERVRGDDAPAVPLPAPRVSLDPGRTAVAASRLTAAWLLFVGLASLGGGHGTLRRFGWVVAANAALLALVSLAQALSWNGKILWLYPSPHGGPWSSGGPFVCHSHLAEYLNLGMGLAVGLMLGGDRGGPALHRSDRLWAAYLVGVIGIGVVASQSRGGVLAMLAAGAATPLLFRAGRAGFALLAVAAAAVAAGAVALGDLGPFVDRVATVLNPAEQGYAVRLDLWRDALSVWRSHPVFGTGLGTFGPAVAPSVRNHGGSFFTHAENVYVQILVESGVVGAALAAAVVLAVASHVRRTLPTRARSADRGLALGACAGVAAVGLQFISDFGLYIPGVAVPVVALAGLLCGARAPGNEVPAVNGARRALGAAAVAAIAGLAVYPAYLDARAEAAYLDAGLQPPETEWATPTLPVLPASELAGTRDQLRRAVAIRPDWAEAHLRLGLTELALYRAVAEDWLAEAVDDPAERRRLADPLTLLTILREKKADAGVLLDQPPVLDHLVPAARSFLEARRCSAVLPIPHAELGALAWLLEPDDDPTPHLKRALATAGPFPGVPYYVASVAARNGDPETAATAWRTALRDGDTAWQEVADASIAALPPAEILESVIPADRPHLALLFADRLFRAPGRAGDRALFLRRAAENLPDDPDVAPPERARMEADAWHALGDRVRARAAMEKALALTPDQFRWRASLVDWLLEWGEAREANNQALLAVHFADAANREEANKLLTRTGDALARGDSGAR